MPLDIPADGDLWEGGGRRYRMEKVVGNGAFGIVWRAREEGASESVAIKKVVLDRRYHNRELEMMKRLDHECVIKLHHSFEKPCVPPHPAPPRGRRRRQPLPHRIALAHSRPCEPPARPSCGVAAAPVDECLSCRATPRLAVGASATRPTSTL